jgi:hypothetical protein
LKPVNGIGDRNGPRYTVGWHEMITCSWPAIHHGVVIVDNHDGMAFGRAIAVAYDQESAEEIVTLLNAAHCDHKFVDGTVCLKCGWKPWPTTPYKFNKPGVKQS